ncbi:MAG: TonB-dependent receptor, partial [Pedobacter sp.]
KPKMHGPDECAFTNDLFNAVNILNSVAYNQPDYRQENTGRSAETTAQVDYVYPLKKVMIEAGVKAIFRDNTSDFNYLSRNTAGDYVLDPLLTNGFDNKQNVYSLYNTYQFNIKKMGVKAGVRLEQTDIDADFTGVGSTLNYNTFNVIPSLSLNYKFKNMTGLNFGYTSRIQRPGINQLNPFVDKSNPNFESTGNPDLKPMVGHSMDVSFSSFKKFNLNVSFRTMLINNMIMPKIITDPATQITRTSFNNVGDATAFGLNINMNYPFSQKLRAQAGIMGNYGILKGEVNGVPLTKRGLMRRAMASLTYRPAKTWTAGGSFNYNGPSLNLQRTTNSFFTSSFSVNKEFMDNKFTVSLAANNVFSKYRNAINYSDGPNFIQESYNQTYMRNFTMSVNYRFGRLKNEIKKNKRGISNNDVSEGSNL